ncbi:MAG: nucleoside deaminase [Alphaproteobacteria bacterium]|nr:nucleoside deaminase [Alphaproteobacteria bacterium]
MMKLAVDQAKLAIKHADVPVGAVIVCNGQVLGVGHNRVEIDNDPTAHAEIVAIRAATAKICHKFMPDNTEIYITLEPCAMCAAAISYARISKIIYAAADEKGGAIAGNSRIFETDRHLFRPEITRDLTFSDDCSTMLKDFFKGLR